MNLFRVNTTGFHEEDFLLVTDLTVVQVYNIIEPLVLAERNGGKEYNNSMLVKALVVAYPLATVKEFDEDEINIISI
jgi:hypothetical protein